MNQSQRSLRRLLQDKNPNSSPRRRGRRLLASVQSLESRALLSTFTVTSTLDDGSAGTLRWAINQVNADTDTSVDLIKFNITTGSGPFTIAPTSPLPSITHPVTINGYTQPGASENSLAQGDNAVILVTLSGANTPSADGLTIAADGSSIRGLNIGGFNDGIHLFANNTAIAGNFIGTNAAGTAMHRNALHGIEVDGSHGNTIGGKSPAARNILSGNGGNLTLDHGATDNLVQGNYIGTDATGTRAIASFFNRGNGIMLLSAPGNTIGGATGGAGNLISGNADAIQIILLFGVGQTGGTLVQGNLIGTDVTGTQAIGNNGAGILFNSSPSNTIGGTSVGAGNVISANGGGMAFFGQASSANVIQGNNIGTDITGEVPLGNGGQGIFMADSGSNTIGGTTAHAGNVISANGLEGILATSEIAGRNVIQGNFIGTDSTGTLPMGNGGDGIRLIDEFQNTIGGTARGAGNIISANAGNGIEYFDVFASNNVVQGNSIGTDGTGTLDLGNGQNGVLAGVSFNAIGGTSAAEGNLIAFNGGAGVAVPNRFNTVTGIAILSNSIYANDNLGIDLGQDGVTPNHPVSPTPGPNNNQNFPVLNVAARRNNQNDVAVKGTLTSIPNTTFTLQFFANPAPDPSGFGQGQNLVGTTTVATDSTGKASFQFLLTSPSALGSFIAATATDPNGNTSEFSADVQVVSTQQQILAQDDAYQVNPDHTLTVTPPGVQGNDIALQGGSLTSVLVTGPAHGTLSLNGDGSFIYTPNAGYHGPDTFTYKDVQGSLQSNVATVSIDVNAITFTVTNTNDSGVGSLRSAITQANAVASTDTIPILFAIPGTGPFTISLASPLPTITHSVIVDGYSEPGAAPNTQALSDDATLLIVLNGASSGGDGLTVAATNTTIRGLIIDSFSSGIHLLPSAANDVISGNFIGTGASGTGALGSSVGIFVDGGSGNTIGGTAPADRNLVAASFSQNIFLANGASGNLIAGNFVGIAASGTSAIHSQSNGVYLSGGSNNTLGGTTSGAGNVIAGQAGDAVIVTSAYGDVVQGNLIGTDPTGTLRLGNGTDAIGVSNASGNLFGGTAPGAGNTLVASRVGIFLDGAADGNTIQGNFVGTNAAGAMGLGNTNAGVGVFNGSNNLIGGTAAGAGNVIVNNGDRGILFAFTSNGNTVQGNWIGTTPAGTPGMGNAANGVEFIFGPSSNTVGGLAAGAGNVIANNGGAGVAVVTGDAIHDAILSNSIYGNAGHGIVLGSGANQSQPAPVLSSATFAGGATTIDGSLSAAPLTTYTLQFFSNDAPDPSGFGQGQTLLGTVTVTTDASGSATFSVSLATADTTGKAISATATDPFGNTSAFAQNVTATDPPALAQPSAAPAVSSSNSVRSSPPILGAMDDATLTDLALSLLHGKTKHTGSRR